MGGANIADSQRARLRVGKGILTKITKKQISNKIKLNKNILLIGILFLVLPNVSALIISEIMYAPTQSESFNEWIEIYNDGGSEIDLSNWTLCGDTLLPGYIDKNDGEKLKLNNSMTLNAGSYAIITDGGSGTEVYSNFNVNGNSIALHTLGATMCSNGLSNSGETIILKDNSGNIINSVTYDSNLANNNDKSLQICSNSWIDEIPTPGSSNSCSTPNPQNQTQENQTQTNTSQTNNQTEESTNISASENNASNNVVKTEPKPSSTGNTIKEDEVIVLNSLDTKDINNEESAKKSDKSNYAKYILTAFVFLLALLFLLKGKIFKKEYKNEFKK